jgi:hypothetical protein
MFNDNATYPYLTRRSVHIAEVPSFTDSRDLLTAQVDSIKAFSVGTVDLASTNILSDWRLVNTGALNYIYSDWPIPVDLSYSNANLLAGATGGFPVGDLNWFPARKATWAAQEDAENAVITNALNTGTTTITAVNEAGTVPLKFQLQQNFPNPFNPSTKIVFTLPKASNTRLTVFNELGQKVATMLDGYQSAGQHIVTFNGSSLASGTYFYRLEAGSLVSVKKMLLMK